MLSNLLLLFGLFRLFKTRSSYLSANSDICLFSTASRPFLSTDPLMEQKQWVQLLIHWHNSYWFVYCTFEIFHKLVQSCFQCFKCWSNVDHIIKGYLVNQVKFDLFCTDCLWICNLKIGCRLWKYSNYLFYCYKHKSRSSRNF